MFCWETERGPYLKRPSSLSFKQKLTLNERPKDSFFAPKVLHTCQVLYRMLCVLWVLLLSTPCIFPSLTIHMPENIFSSNLKLLKLVYVFRIFQSKWSEWYYCYNNPKQTNHILYKPLLRPQMINSWAMRSSPKKILEKIWRPWEIFVKGKKGKIFLLNDNNTKTFKPSRIILDFVCFPQRILFTELLFAKKPEIQGWIKQRFPWQSLKINWFMVSTVYPPNYGCIWVLFKHYRGCEYFSLYNYLHQLWLVVICQDDRQLISMSNFPVHADNVVA